MSFIDIDIKELPLKRVITSKIKKGTFDKPGGSMLSKDFVNNPQFSLSLAEDSHLLLKVQSEDETKQLMVMMFESGKDIMESPYPNIV